MDGCGVVGLATHIMQYATSCSMHAPRGATVRAIVLWSQLFRIPAVVAFLLSCAGLERTGRYRQLVSTYVVPFTSAESPSVSAAVRNACEEHLTQLFQQPEKSRSRCRREMKATTGA